MHCGTFNHSCPAAFWLENIRTARDGISYAGLQVPALAKSSNHAHSGNTVSCHLDLVLDETYNVRHYRLKDFGLHIVLCHGVPISSQAKARVDFEGQRFAFWRKGLFELQHVKLADSLDEAIKILTDSNSFIAGTSLSSVQHFSPCVCFRCRRKRIFSMDEPHFPPVPSVTSFTSSRPVFVT